MTEQPAAAPPAATPAPAPAAAAPAAAAGSQPAGLSATEQKQLDGLLAKRAAAAAAAGEIQMKVEPPHVSLTHGGVTITNEFSTVPAGMAAAIAEAAADAGVKITQET